MSISWDWVGNGCSSKQVMHFSGGADLFGGCIYCENLTGIVKINSISDL